MKPVDAHAHLYFDKFDKDREEVIERAKSKLEFVAVPGCDPETNRKVIELSEKYQGFVVPNIGLHPTFTSAFDSISEVKSQIRSEDPPAVGEIGLDHHHVEKEEMREKQEHVFRELLELAEELNKPVVVHSREAEKKCVDIISEYEIPEVMLHCFNGSPELAEKAVENEYLIGVTTQVIYSNRVQDIVNRIEVDDMLLETDSPFLYRGERNEPANVAESADKIADIKNTDRQDVVDITGRNACNIFNM